MLLKMSRLGAGEGLMRWGFLWIGGIFLLSLMSSSTIVAQGIKRPLENIKFTREGRGASNLKEARDHPLVKRFPGSSIIRYKKVDSGIYTLPIGPIVRWDYANEQPDFAGRKLDLDGEVTRITYLVRPGAFSAEVFGSLKNDLMAKGFKPYYEAQGAAFGRAQGNLYKNVREQLFEYSPKEARFLSAKYDSAPATVYVALYVTEYEIGTTSVRVRPGQVVLQLDLIEVKPVSDKLVVVVSASDISRGLETSGRVALYGILFDTNKSEIKPESRPALDEIAKYLHANPNVKLDVVGHTDNIGSYDSNLDLSRARAAGVVRALVNEWNINPQRLRASGVGFLAPIASNANDDGRTKNRRVELLLQ
jgi:OmpA-OmpF porin, OOP family